MRFGAMVVGATGTGKSSLLRTLQVICCAPSAFTLLSVGQRKCRPKACDTSCAMPSACFMLVLTILVSTGHGLCLLCSHCNMDLMLLQAYLHVSQPKRHAQHGKLASKVTTAMCMLHGPL